MYIVSGTGDVIEPNLPLSPLSGPAAAFEKPAATALVRNTNLGAREIVEKAMKIAGDICIYTNDSVSYEELG